MYEHLKVQEVNLFFPLEIMGNKIIGSRGPGITLINSVFWGFNKFHSDFFNSLVVP